MISSNNLTERVLRNIKYFANPEYKHFKIKDYDINPSRPIPVKRALAYFLSSINHHLIIQFKVKIRQLLDQIQGKPKKYDGPYLNKKG
jgi:hypothetical protein